MNQCPIAVDATATTAFADILYYDYIIHTRTRDCLGCKNSRVINFLIHTYYIHQPSIVHWEYITNVHLSMHHSFHQWLKEINTYTEHLRTRHMAQLKLDTKQSTRVTNFSTMHRRQKLLGQAGMTASTIHITTINQICTNFAIFSLCNAVLPYHSLSCTASSSTSCDV